MKGFFQNEWHLSTIIPMGWLVAAYNLTVTGDALLLCVPAEVLNDVLGTEDMGLVWPRTRVSIPYCAKLFELGPTGVRAHDLAGLCARGLLVDLLPGSRALVCGARARPDAHGGERNATVFDLNDGQELDAFTLGDGVGHVQAVEDGSIFVGYLDQGVEGALGWGAPVGASGLVRFDQKGNQTWQFPSSPKLAPIDDCYALNATLNETWLYYYRDFSLVRLDAHGNPDTVWNLGVQGAHALAVKAGYVALFGSYADSRDCTLLRLSANGAADEVYTFQLPLPPHSRMVARGQRYGTLAANRWLTGDLESIIAGFERPKS